MKFNDKLYYDGEWVAVVSNKVSATAKKVNIEIPSTGKRVFIFINEALTLKQWQEQQQSKITEAVEIKEAAKVEEVREVPEVREVKASINISDPQEFAAIVLALDEPEAIKEMCDRLCDRVFPIAGSHNPKSRSDKLNRLGYNKLFRNAENLVEGQNAFYQTKQDGSLWLRHLYFKYVGIADTNWAEINTKGAEKVKANLADQIVGLDIAKYEESVRSLLASDRIWEIGAGLIAASGRRPSEVAICGEFEESGDGNGLIFSGQAKKRGNDSEAYPIPLIGCTPELFLKKLKIFRNSPEVRRYADRENLKEATSPINTQINRVGIVTIFGWLPVPGEKSNPTCSDLRAAWVTIVEQKFKPEGKYSLLFRSEMLGHELKIEGVAALNYSRYAMTEETSQVDFVADLREVEATCQEWEKEVIEPRFQSGDRVVWCNHPGTVDWIIESVDSPTFDYKIKLDNGQHGLAIHGKNLEPKIEPKSIASDEASTKNITAISLHQPWASLIASGQKRYETRSWPTNHRGLIAIHAAKKIEPDTRLLNLLGIAESDVPRGAVVAIADLVDCIQMDAKFIEAQSGTERMCGDWSVGRWAWKLENIRAIEPISARGMQGLWHFPLPQFLNVISEEGNYPSELPAPANGRHEHDFYETPPWLTLLALANVPLSGKILEPCVGHRAIASILKMAGLELASNDIDVAKPADFHLDATLPESWANFPAVDWVVTNPPYADLSAPIVKLAYAHANKGIVMVLRQNWAEACEDRREFLVAHPPTMLISVPRYCYRKGKNGSWATDQCPTWLYVWDKADISGLTRIVTLWDDLIPLYHRTPDGIPSDEAISAEVARIVGTRSEVAKVVKPQSLAMIGTSDWEQEQIDKLLETNQALGDGRFYVSQTLIKRLLKCRDQTANLILRLNKAKIDALNKGINHTVNRGRETELDKLISSLIS